MNDVDTRNLITEFKGMAVSDVISKLDESRTGLHIAIENWTHDFNIGSIVRTANAFNVAAIHIIGKRRWNRRGAMMTDIYQHVYHHYTIAEFAAWAKGDTQLRSQLRAKTISEDLRSEEHLEELAPDNLTSIPVYAIDILEDVSTPIEDFTFPEKCVLLYGSEGEGLTSDAQKLALESTGQLLHITQNGSTRSINAGHAAAITMYHWQLRHGSNG